MTTILFSAPYMLPHIERFRPVLTHYGLDVIVAPVQERLDEAQLMTYAGQFDGTLCGDDRYTARVLGSLRPAPQGDLQVGHRYRFDRRASLRTAGHHDWAHAQCLYIARG